MLAAPFILARARARVCLALIASFLSVGAAQADDVFAGARQRMVREIELTQRGVADETGQRGFAPSTLAVLGRTPRHLFVPEQETDAAYENRPLPIGHGQTISQPYIVALMTDLLDVDIGERVFELGTGSGYQAAVLAQLAREVYSVEIVPELGQRAARTLARLGYDNVQVKVADGYYGWPEHGPFDAIIVTAAASNIPPPLIEQLAPGGRMVIPLGTSFLTQQLMLVEKQHNGEITTRQVLPVRFVPLTGSH